MTRILTAIIVSCLSLLQGSLALAIEIPSSKSPLFQSQETLHATLTADFSALFASAALLTIPTGKQSNSDPEAFVKGLLSYEDELKKLHEIPVDIRVRGNTTQICRFPKLRLEFSRESVAETIFKNSESLKVATHCEDQDVLPNVGPLVNQKSAHREALVYQIFEAWGIPTFKARAAVISYIDTGKNNTLTLRAAAFIETPKVFKKRMRASEIFFEGSLEARYEAFQANRNGTEQPTLIYSIENKDEPLLNDLDTAKAITANLFIGNADWFLPAGKDSGSNMNFKAYETKDGKSRFVVPHDFDRSDIVRKINDPFVRNFLMASQIPRFQNVLGLDVFTQAGKDLAAQKKKVEELIDKADLTYPDLKTGKLTEDAGEKSQLKMIFSPMWHQYKN